MRRALAAACLGLAVLGLPAAADASTLSLDAGVLTYQAAPGEANHVQATRDDVGRLLLRDDGATIDPAPCAPKGDACGGDPSGQWTVVDSCRDPAYQNPEAVTYYGQPSNMAHQTPPEPTSSDWCSYLLYDPVKGITQFTFPHDTLAIRTGHVSYEGLGTYAALLSTIGSGAVDISASCLTRFSVLFQCAPADPSVGMAAPVMFRAASEARNATSSATSSAGAMRLRAVWLAARR